LPYSPFLLTAKTALSKTHLKAFTWKGDNPKHHHLWLVEDGAIEVKKRSQNHIAQPGDFIYCNPKEWIQLKISSYSRWNRIQFQLVYPPENSSPTWPEQMDQTGEDFDSSFQEVFGLIPPNILDSQRFGLLQEPFKEITRLWWRTPGLRLMANAQLSLLLARLFLILKEIFPSSQRFPLTPVQAALKMASERLESGITVKSIAESLGIPKDILNVSSERKTKGHLAKKFNVFASKELPKNSSIQT